MSFIGGRIKMDKELEAIRKSMESTRVERFSVLLAMMGDLDERIMLPVKWTPEEIKEIGMNKIMSPAIGGFSGLPCCYSLVKDYDVWRGN